MNFIKTRYTEVISVVHLGLKVFDIISSVS